MLVDHFTREARLIADLPLLKAAVDTNDPTTVQPMAADYHRQLTADLLLVTGRQGQMLAEIASANAATGSYASLPGVKSAATGRESSSFWPHPGGILQIVTVPDLDRSTAARDPRHAQRRRQPRQRRGEPVQVVDQQRNRLRDDRGHASLDALAGALAGAGAAPRPIGRVAERAASATRTTSRRRERSRRGWRRRPSRPAHRRQRFRPARAPASSSCGPEPSGWAS